MRKRKITALIVLVTLFMSIFSTGLLAKNYSANVNVQVNKDGSVQVAMKFKDLQEAAWAMKNILKMNAKDIIMGYTDGCFRPNKPVTHAEAVVLTMRAAGLESEIDSKVADAVYLSFKDAKSIPGWAKNAVAVAVEKGYLEAGPSGNFQANKAASREWVVKLIAKALSLEPVEIELPFTDAGQISADTADYVAAVVYKQLISGFPDGSFKPNKPVTRAEIAVMLGIACSEEPIPGEFKFKVEGTIDSVSPKADNVADENYGSVTDDVYGGTQPETQGTITLKLDDDKDGQDKVTYPVSSSALIYVDDKTAKLGDLTVGAKAEAIIKNGMVVYLEVEPVIVKGVVQAVYNDTITVISNNWGHGMKNFGMPEAKTYNLADDAAVTLNGLTAKATDLKAGDCVKMTLNADEEVSNIKAARFVLRIHMKNDKPNPQFSGNDKDREKEDKNHGKGQEMKKMYKN